MLCALLQVNSSDQPNENLDKLVDMLHEAAASGAKFVLTPEVSNCMSSSRSHQNMVLRSENEDATLAGLRAAAKSAGVWLSIGSLALKTNDRDERFANRQFMISPAGEVVARYDKIHMFDVDVSPTETYRESDGFRPGDRAVVADTDFGRVGMTICYDVRFPHLHRRLAQAGASILTAPAAFSSVTGRAHWHSLLRARAIETGCYVLAAAQTGSHVTSSGKQRETYGHSLAVSPWGEVLLDAGQSEGCHYVDVDTGEVDKSRARVPSLRHDRAFKGP